MDNGFLEKKKLLIIRDCKCIKQERHAAGLTWDPNGWYEKQVDIHSDKDR